MTVTISQLWLGIFIGWGTMLALLLGLAIIAARGVRKP